MWDPDAYKRALDFAAKAHGEQRVPGSGFPYVVHLTKVAAEVMHACALEPALDGTLAVTCALLHDSLEDAGVTKEQLVATFGQGVADGVDALTKRDALPKAEQMRDSLQRILAQPREIAVVKLADRITNLEPAPAHWSPEKRAKYRDEAREILAALGDRCAPLKARIAKKIDEYET